MSKTDYFKRPGNGRQPAKEWYDGQDRNVQVSVDARLDALREDWRYLVDTGTLVPITRKYKEHGFYELKDTKEKWRLFMFHDLSNDRFILLDGYRKTKSSKKEQEAAIRKAHGFLKEYWGE